VHTHAKGEPEVNPRQALIAPHPGGGALAGLYPRDHLRHAVCGRVCLQDSQFQQLVRKFGGLSDAAEQAVRAWAEALLAAWDLPPLIQQPIQGTTFQWWDARWEEWQGRPQAATKRLTEDADTMNAGVLALLKKEGVL